MPTLHKDPAHRLIALTLYSAVLLTGFFLISSSNAAAQSTLGATAYRFATQAAFSGFFPYDTCNSDVCSSYTSSGGPAYTADTYIAYHWTMFFAAVGEVVSTSAIKPDGSIAQGPILTWQGYSSLCGGNLGEWTDQYGGYYCDPSGYGEFISGVSVNCQPSGAWTFQLTDNGVVKFSTPITLAGC